MFWFRMAIAATTSLVALVPVSMRLLVHGIMQLFGERTGKWGTLGGRFGEAREYGPAKAARVFQWSSSGPVIGAAHRWE